MASSASSGDTWILCFNLWGARLFSYDRDDTPQVKFIKEYPHPSPMTWFENLPSRELAESVDTLLEDPHKEWIVAHQVTAFLASEIEYQCRRDKFESLILCADPRLLNLFQERVANCVRKNVTGTIPLDLYEVNESDLENYLHDMEKKAA